MKYTARLIRTRKVVERAIVTLDVDEKDIAKAGILGAFMNAKDALEQDGDLDLEWEHYDGETMDEWYAYGWEPRPYNPSATET